MTAIASAKVDLLGWIWFEAILRFQIAGCVACSPGDLCALLSRSARTLCKTSLRLCLACALLTAEHRPAKGFFFLFFRSESWFSSHKQQKILYYSERVRLNWISDAFPFRFVSARAAVEAQKKGSSQERCRIWIPWNLLLPYWNLHEQRRLTRLVKNETDSRTRMEFYVSHSICYAMEFLSDDWEAPVPAAGIKIGRGR